MKQSIKKRYHLMLILLFALIVLQFVVVLITIGQADSLYLLASDIQSIMIVFLFAIFVYMVLIYNYLPYRIARAVKRVQDLIEEISNGNYQIDIDSTRFEHDHDFQELIFSLKKMLDIIMRFDAVKADKIYEHHQRLNQLINLLADIVLIVTVNGDIVYINEVFRKRFPSISDTSNLNEVIQKDDFHARIFDVISESLRFGNNIYDERVQIEGSPQTALIKGSIIRSRKGVASGGVYTVEIIGEQTQN